MTECGLPTGIANGTFTYDGTGVGDNVKYTCDVGFTLTGTLTITCDVNATWSDVPPTCTIVDCGYPDPPENGNVTCDSGTTFDQVAVYTCNTGYYMTGFSSRRCFETGSWGGLDPFCTPYDCGIPPAPENGDVDVTSGTTYGQTAMFSCWDGFALVGADSSTCNELGQWGSVSPYWIFYVPLCILINCSIPESPDNGDVDYSSGTLNGTTAFYSCNPGYGLVNGNARVCLSDSTWSLPMPTCVEVICYNISGDFNTYEVVGNGTQQDDVAVYKCIEGYSLLNDLDLRTCQSDGHWSEPTPQCLLSDCGIPESPEKGIVTFSHTTVGNVSVYSCNYGYSLLNESENQRVCQTNGSWSLPIPTCVLYDINSVTFTTSVTTVSDVTTASSRSAVATVTSTSTVNGVTPTQMFPILCDSLTSPLNGYVETSNGTVVGSVARYTCQTGYNIEGPSERSCLENGQWNSTTPICAELDCGPPSAPQFGGVNTLNGTTFGNLAYYFCDDGFDLSGDGSRVCTSDDEWNATNTTCIPKDCGDLTNPNNGHVHTPNGTTYGMTAVYTCHDDWILEGPESRVCLSNGLWEVPAPLCLDRGNKLSCFLFCF